jgi:hypothetical protein
VNDGDNVDPISDGIQEPIRDRFETYHNEVFGIEFTYPDTWYITEGVLPGRYKGLDTVRLASFPYDPFITHSLPDGDWTMITIDLVGNNLEANESLEDYIVRSNIGMEGASIITNNEQIGDNSFMKWESGIGTTWVISEGSNVYFIFRYAGSSAADDTMVEQFLGSFTVLRADPVNPPPNL